MSFLPEDETALRFQPVQFAYFPAAVKFAIV